MNYTLDKKNQIASNTIEFIERQLVGVMDSLAAAESVLEGFRSRNEVMDVSFQGQMIITQSNELENEKATLEARLDYLTYLLNNIENNLDINDIVAPSAMGVNDPVLNQLIGELASLNAEKSSLQFNTNIENPNIVRINHRIQTLRNSLLQTTRSIIETTQLSLNDLNKRLYQLSQEIRKLPKTEQTLLNIERKFRMNDEMYTYLLERRAEAQLAKSSNLPDHEIVEEAIARGQVTPDKTRSMLMIVVFGLMFPAVIVFLKVYNNDKIQDESEISELTNYPLIGTVPLHSDSNKRLVLEANSHSPLAEAFRNIRTSIGFYALEQPEKTILVTSSVPSEGKTVFAANLANSFAQLGKTTLLMGFDLRMPAINEEMFPDLKTPGLVHYLLGEKEWETLVQPSRTGNLNILTSGDIPPNPTELIANKKTDQLFTNLKKHFEIIIIDTPP
ncbi:GumC family protein [Marinilabilia salmonicolor]|uniref:GumC family protein n=1 Tax=Marinilabilia salmonicolor TaxID=989 RepID=UPI00046AFD8E|nr:polysaccharide biosynthesis tyrosine autokinase [Marinilabilia salmonicolor]